LIDEKVSQVGVEAVKALDKEPHRVLLNGHERGHLRQLLCHRGRWQMALRLRRFGVTLSQKPLTNPSLNLTYQYLKLALDGKTDGVMPTHNLFPEGYFLVRQLDAGVILEHEGKTWRII